jgi:hypothetical protein
MKKLAIGCAVVIVLCMVGFGAVAYYVYYKAHQYMASMQEFAELDTKVTNKASFPEPSSGELTDDQMRRFVSVQETMRTKLGPRLEELSAKQKQFEALQKSEHRDASFSEVMTAVSSLLGLIKDAKTAQVEALNASNFSLKEYQWVRGQVYTAAGMAFAQVNFNNLQNLQDSLKDGANNNSSRDLERMAREVPEKNRQLVQPYAEKMKDWVPFAFFGL